MRIAIFGLGYVGCTAACCIASEGHDVIGIDVSDTKVDSLLAGDPPITEPGLGDLLRQALDAGRITATTTIGDDLAACDMAIVCVGTPSAPDGSHNMRYIVDVSRQIATSLKTARRTTPLTVTYRSTIRPGTIDRLITPIFEGVLGEDGMAKVELAYNPEFLREASAVHDYFNPPKIVIGTRDGQPCANLDALHEGIEAPVFYTGFREAEITKFVDNTWHAVKVAYANEIGRICQQLDISARKVHEIFVSDTKLNISSYYTRPGGAFGGSCLPKDVRALQHISTDIGANTHLVDALIRSNEAHKRYQFERIAAALPQGARVLLAGLAFKTGTDDLRESPNLDMARQLLQAGFTLSIYDANLDASKLIGQNLGYAYSHLPSLDSLLVDKATAEAGSYDLVIAANATIKKLDLAPDIPVVDIGTIA